MVAITYKLDHVEKNQIKLEAAYELSEGSELEKRLISCLNDAVEGAMQEVLWKYQNSILVSKKNTAEKARAIMRKHLDQLDPEK
jgi:hypothetical protein